MGFADYFGAHSYNAERHAQGVRGREGSDWHAKFSSASQSVCVHINGCGYWLWAWVFERYYKELLGYLSRKVSDKAAAADLTQEAYLRIYSSPHATGDVQSPRSLLYKVAQNLVIDHYRHQNTREQVVSEDPDGELSAHYSGPHALEPEMILSTKQRLACIEAVLAALPPRPREAFVLFKIEGLSRAEVAEHMGIGVRTVETHLHVAMQACIQALQTCDGARVSSNVTAKRDGCIDKN